MSRVSHPAPRLGRLLFGAAILGAAVAALAPVEPSASASGSICMGIVIDYGTPSSPPSSVVPPATASQSASVAPGTSDEQALAEAGDSIAANASGLVCAINGYPADGVQNCTATSGDDYYFWSYWQGNPATNTWTYANVGPASHTVNNGDTYVEGWRYQNPGPASPAAASPSVTPAAAFAQACPGVPPVAASGGGSGTGSTGSGSGSDSGAGSGPGGSSETSTSEPGPSGGASSGGGGSAVSGGSVSATPAGHPATPTTIDHTGATTTVASKSTTTSTTIRDGASVAGHSTRKLNAAPAVSRHGGGAGPGTLPVVIVAIVVAALIGAAVARWRRRPVEE